MLYLPSFIQRPFWENIVGVIDIRNEHIYGEGQKL